MADYDDRQVGDLRVRIDRTLCVGFGDCVTGAPEAFQLADDGVVVFLEPQNAERTQFIEACDACPVDALAVWDATGQQIVPS